LTAVLERLKLRTLTEKQQFIRRSQGMK